MAVRKNAPALPLGLLLLVLSAGALLALGGAWAIFGRATGPAPFVPPPGAVAVPMAGRTIPAYTKITRDDLFSPRVGRLNILYLQPAQVTSEMITDFSQIVGRVLAREKAEDRAFADRDFLPEGTRPGVVAGIPAGKRALRLEAEKVQGLIGLLPGDRFDVVATRPVEGRASGPELGGPYGALLGQQLQRGAKSRAVVTVVIQNGVVVTPVQTRQVPTTTATLTQGTRTQTRPVQEMVVAIDPAEVAPFTEALAIDAQLTCLPRSGRPDDPGDSVTPGSVPALPGGHGDQSVPPLEVLDRIQGSDRELLAVPRADGRPQ